MKPASKEIRRILWEEYGVTSVNAPVEAVLWAAAKCSNPKASLAAANEIRTLAGRMPAYAPYGHVAF